MEVFMVLLCTVFSWLVFGLFIYYKDKIKDDVIFGTGTGLFISFALAGTFQIVVRTFELFGTSW